MIGEELLINVTPQETRVATVESGVLQELWIERADQRGIVGNIYKGIVARVLPGIESAFVEIGLDRAAFLHVTDLANWQKFTDDGCGGRRKKTIGEALYEGQEVLVQVTKTPIGSKGARLTTSISIPSRHLVYMPGSTTVGVSGKIATIGERTRLRELVNRAAREVGPGGFIVRTAAEGIEGATLHREVVFLQKIWRSLEKGGTASGAAALVHEDLPLVLRILRDLPRESVAHIRIDCREALQKAQDFCRDFFPETSPLLQHYSDQQPIFDHYAIEDEIHKALSRKVPLRSGGYLIIDQTESMTTIDVNTGGFIGHRTLEDTIFKTNLEAAQAIARQLRLRNLGGIIILDLIDMACETHQQQVLEALGKAVENDPACNKIGGFSPFGLVEMTRKRTRESLEQVLCEVCSACNGRGTVKTAETICYEIEREILRLINRVTGSPESVLVLASQDVVDMLLDERAKLIAALQNTIGASIRLQGEYTYSQEQYDVVLV